jgi:hypothetical protein
MSAAADLVREALKDPELREEIKAIVIEAGSTSPANEVDSIEPLIDARGAGKLLGMTAAAVRAAAFRGTLPSHHVGRLLRFRASELLPARRG